MKKQIMYILLLLTMLSTVFAIDTTLSTSGLTAHTGVITLTANETVNTRLYISENSDYDPLVYTEVDLVTNATEHVWLLTGLDSYTTYYYKVNGTGNTSGVTYDTGSETFTTLGELQSSSGGFLFSLLCGIVGLGIILVLTKPEMSFYNKIIFVIMGILSILIYNAILTQA